MKVRLYSVFSDVTMSTYFPISIGLAPNFRADVCTRIGIGVRGPPDRDAHRAFSSSLALVQEGRNKDCYGQRQRTGPTSKLADQFINIGTNATMQALPRALLPMVLRDGAPRQQPRIRLKNATSSVTRRGT